MKLDKDLKKGLFLVVLAMMISCLTMFNITLLLFLSLFFLLSIPIINSIIKRRNLLTPINLFCFLYMISFVIIPILNHFYFVSYDPAYANYEKIYELKTQILSILALLFLYFGYYEGIVSNKMHNLLPKFKGTVNYNKAKLLIIIIFIIVLFSFLYLIRNFDIKVKNFSEYFIYTNVSSFGRGHVAFFCYSYIFAFFICIMAIFDEKVKRKNIFWFFIMLSIFIAILSRSRGHLVLLSFITLIFYNYRVKRINFLNLLKIFIIILIMVFLIAQFRGSKDFRITKKNISNAFGGLFTEFQATATLLSQYERRRLEHYNGQIFFQDVALSLIPRKIWPEKPKLYGGVFVTDILIPNRQPGFYYTVGTFGGSFADFGYIGVILMMFFAGFFMRIGYDYMMKNIENDFILLIYAIFCFYLWAFIRGGLGSIPVLVEKLFPIILIYLLITEKRKKGNFI